MSRNYYADHLVEINKLNTVVATQDICDELGTLIVSEGTYISESVATKISEFWLSEPLELQVELASTLTPDQICSDLLFAQRNIFRSKENTDAQAEIARQCDLLQAHPLMLQKLSVLAERMPAKYSNTQSATCFAVLIGLELHLNDESMEVVFAATQMHDAGFLNIDPNISAVIDLLPYVERRELFKQQLSLGKSFLDQIPNLSGRIGQTVLMHRERKDGSGWPDGAIDDNQSIESQVVGLAVMLQEAYAHKLKPRGYGTQHLLPIIQMEAQGLDNAVYRAAIEVLRQGMHGSLRVIPTESMANLAKYLIILQRTLVHWMDLAKECAQAMQCRQPGLNIERSLVIIASLEQLLRNSGLWEKNIRSWLDNTANKGDEDDFAEVEVIALMFDSIYAKLKCLLWAMREAAANLGDEWLCRCNELAILLYSLPKDHFEAIGKQPRLKVG